MKNTLKSIWVNCQSVVYTILTIVGLVLILAGGLLALPVVLVFVVGVIIFIAYKIGMATDDIEEENLNDPDWYLKPVKRYKDDDKY